MSDKVFIFDEIVVATAQAAKLRDALSGFGIKANPVHPHAFTECSRHSITRVPRCFARPVPISRPSLFHHWPRYSTFCDTAGGSSVSPRSPRTGISK